jgi:hypothetical protein
VGGGGGGAVHHGDPLCHGISVHEWRVRGINSIIFMRTINIDLIYTKFYTLVQLTLSTQDLDLNIFSVVVCNIKHKVAL